MPNLYPECIVLSNALSCSLQSLNGWIVRIFLMYNLT